LYVSKNDQITLGKQFIFTYIYLLKGEREQLADVNKECLPFKSNGMVPFHFLAAGL